tara:strand:+ start:3566 stop:4564 length:999 start_codon:yes stop_codon:yes gene_type:complete
MENDMVVFLSWHNSLPGYISKVYSNLNLPKSFVSRDFVKGLDNKALMHASNSYKAPTDHAVINLLENLNPSHLVVWNGDFNDSQRGFQVKLISLIKSTFPNIKFVYCEHGWMPQKSTFSMDKLGSNGSSSATFLKNIPQTTALQSVINKRAQYTNAAKPVNINDYLYLPLQLNSDTQITKYSPHFKDMGEFINHIISLFPNKTLVVKAHPKDKRDNLQRYQLICKQYTNVYFIEDSNNIGWCKSASGIIAINSTVINEALIFRKPIMTYGLNIFSNKGVTYEINDATDLQHQRNFISWKPDLNKIDSYVCWLLGLQFDSSNPNMTKVLNYFK